MMTIWAWSQPVICPVMYHNLEFIFRIFNDSISFGANSRFKTFQFAKGYVWVWLCGSCRCANFIHPRPRLRHTAVDARPTGAVGDLAAIQLRSLCFSPFIITIYTWTQHLSYPWVCSQVQLERGGVRVRTRAQLTTTVTLTFSRPTLSLLLTICTSVLDHPTNFV